MEMTHIGQFETQNIHHEAIESQDALNYRKERKRWSLSIM